MSRPCAIRAIVVGAAGVIALPLYRMYAIPIAMLRAGIPGPTAAMLAVDVAVTVIIVALAFVAWGIS